MITINKSIFDQFFPTLKKLIDEFCNDTNQYKLKLAIEKKLSEIANTSIIATIKTKFSSLYIELNSNDWDRNLVWDLEIQHVQLYKPKPRKFVPIEIDWSSYTYTVIN
jgi:hypothetical protein